MSDDRCDLLVASAGGHLAQLHLLAERLEPRRPQRWVTYDHPQAASLLAGRDVVHGAGPSSRSPAAAVRNWRLAGELVDPERVARVVSTGAAIAVPFLLRAEQRGIEGHYVESATRADGPSLSGRILQRCTRRTGLHTQHASWAGGRWRPTTSVFDGFRTTAGRRADGPLRVVVSLGTHRFPFPRALEWLAPALAAHDEVLLQHGATPPRSLPGRVRAVDSLPAQDLDVELASADVVIGHAGTGLALSSLAAGRAPILLARDAARGEHVDDHQQQTHRTLEEAGLAVAAPAEAPLTREVLLTAAGSSVHRVPGQMPVLLGE